MRAWTLCSALGLGLGFFAAEAGFGDFAYVHAAFSLDPAGGAFPGLFLAFGAAVVLAGAGFRVWAPRDRIPARPFHRGSVPGGLLFGAGWALTGGCPAIVLVQLGSGRLAALAVLAGAFPGFFAARWLRARLRVDGGGCGG